MRLKEKRNFRICIYCVSCPYCVAYKFTDSTIHKHNLSQYTISMTASINKSQRRFFNNRWTDLILLRIYESLMTNINRRITFYEEHTKPIYSIFEPVHKDKLVIDIQVN